MGSGNFTTKIEEILEKVDIVEVVSEYVKLKKCGKSYKSLCPFHPEKTPSFFVHPEKQIFHCFGCGIGGNVIKFLMNIEKISFYEALKLLANKIGIEITKPDDLKESPERKRILKTNEYVANLYNKLLFSNVGKRALEYLYSRNLTEEDINRFLLGFAPSNNFLLKHIEEEGLNKEDFILAALINEEGNEDTFKNRIIFPIFNIKNEIIGFGGRTIEEDVMPKYLNIRENFLFNKSAVLYGINWAKEGIKNKGFVILTEGYFDVLKMYINGFINSVAPMGTAITDLHLNILKKLTERILLLFDGDDAGIRGCLRNLENILKKGFETKICMLPSGFDPDKFLDEYGSSSLQNFMEKAQDFVDFSISINSQIYNPENPKEKAIIVKETIKLISNIPDEIEKYEYLKKLSSKMDIKIEILEETLKKIAEESLIEEEKYLPPYDFQTNEENLLLEIALEDEKYMERLFEYKGKLTERLEKIIQAGENLMRRGLKINPSLLINECEDGEISNFISSVAIKEIEISDHKKEKIFNDCLKKIRRRRLLEEIENYKKKMNEKIERGEDYKEELEKMQKLLYQLKKEG
ncbi:MAG: DNA primase [Candidatus Omnitrophica bacterium]|nr:DNA primase [Candidatus Omnitrophota bacterium]MCM8806927.1 DNA primase [Candidatus Omnitrophota bacterium]